MIGIIGFGRFGKLTARYLAEDFDVFVFNRTDKSTEIKKTGARKASLNGLSAKNRYSVRSDFHTQGGSRRNRTAFRKGCPGGRCMLGKGLSYPMDERVVT